MFSGAVPPQGENAGHLKMAACLIYTRVLKVISKPPAENARTQGRRPFSDFQAHFRADWGSPTCEQAAGQQSACYFYGPDLAI
jgi:hypothetical protein